MIKNKQKLILPVEFSADLAEETGIHIGDGSMNLYKSSGKNHWGYVHSTHLVDDKEHSKYVKRLMKKLYNIEPYERVYKNCKMLTYTRKNLILFKKKIGMPMGKKDSVKIPEWILENPAFSKRCVRGIFDTDGCIRFFIRKKRASYPEIKITNRSEKLIHQISGILRNNDMRANIYMEKGGKPRKPNPIWHVSIKGRTEVPKFFDIIGSSNSKHLQKYKDWLKENGEGGI